MKKLNKDNKGFSLVELLVVIAIMVVLVGVIAPTLLGNIEKSRVSSDIQTLDAIAGAIQSALGDEKSYSEAMSDTGVHTLEYLYNGATASGSKIVNLSKTVAEYLAKNDISFKGTDVRKIVASSGTVDLSKVTYYITSSGRIVVGIYSTAPTYDDATGYTAGTAVNAKNTDYEVTR